ncbi:hypothetical protein RDI58_028855 [Solanum bulbocastanum]|uniref:Uncharacterized protein n=1 Tax=Solanum bulbocastanum TaxID=147425 RepID=A0AAN8STE8_SOLBU
MREKKREMTMRVKKKRMIVMSREKNKRV